MLSYLIRDISVDKFLFAVTHIKNYSKDFFSTTKWRIKHGGYIFKSNESELNGNEGNCGNLLKTKVFVLKQVQKYRYC